MGTGIVSVALSLDGRDVLSRVLLGLAAAAWVGLAALFAVRLRDDRAGVRRDARIPASLTAVAGTAVVGTGFLSLDWKGVAIALLAVAAVLWTALLPPVLRHWRTPTSGVSLMVTVSTESLAVLMAGLAAGERSRWLLIAALVPLGVGLALYVHAIARLDLRELATGAGDHWITGGALAISTLAAARIALSAAAVHDSLQSPLKDVSIVLWALTLCWLPPLLVAEARFPRLGYDLRRWSTVFPVGMYAACSFAVSSAIGSDPIRTFASTWLWVAFAVWVVVSVASVRAIGRARRAPQREASPRSVETTRAPRA
jgi:tellurite resistance protein TehA-like permease